MEGETVGVGQSSQVGGEVSGASRKEVMRGAEGLKASKPICSDGNYAVYPKGFTEGNAHALTRRDIILRCCSATKYLCSSPGWEEEKLSGILAKKADK